jgi:hypothetical protein
VRDSGRIDHEVSVALSFFIHWDVQEMRRGRERRGTAGVKFLPSFFVGDRKRSSGGKMTRQGSGRGAERRGSRPVRREPGAG